MSRIKELFDKKNSNVLNVYCTAGYPKLDSTLTVMKALQNNGADIIELGMPYSDPLADGPVIQASGTVALHNGMTITMLFEQLKNFRSGNPPLGDGVIIRSDSSPLGAGRLTLPVILMGYMNPILQYGFEKFCADAAAVGVDGLILPDLPQHEFETEYGAIIKKYGLDFIFLVTPETSEERIKELDALSTGFLYAVSSSSTTGKDKDFSAVEKYLQKLQSLQLKNPVLVGFGIKDKQTFEAACRHANGAIIGTAYIKALENTTDVEATTKAFLSGIKS
jgi:tryptophan synthase alpha chain